MEEEFFDFACPAESLGVFLKMCNEETLLHPYCDLRFSRFLQEYYAGGKVATSVGERYDKGQHD